jgi:hypothetical protein
VANHNPTIKAKTDIAPGGFFDRRFTATQYYLRERIIHWRSRNKWLHNHVSIENLQRVLAALTFVVGAFFTLTGSLTSDSTLFMTAPDKGFTWLCPWVFHHIRPHQILGMAAFVGSVYSIVALMNWPVVSEAESRDDVLFDKNYLRKLLGQQKIGTMTCAVFWGLLFVTSFIQRPDTPGPWLAAFAAYVHHWIWVRVNKQYAQDRDRAFQEKRYRKHGYPYQSL